MFSPGPVRTSHVGARTRSPSPSAESIPVGRGPRPGNQAVQRQLRAAMIQPKLTINRPDDPFEREADAVAARVMRMSEPQVQRMCTECREQLDEPAPIRRLCRNCQANLETSPDTDAIIGQLHGGGRPLPQAARTFFEPRLGRDFGDVRVHTDSRAAAAAEAINALAFTVGNRIVFAPGQYAPGTEQGNRLLAHELTHTIQQGGGAATALQRATCPRTPTGIGDSAPASDCTPGSGNVGGAIFYFCSDSDRMQDASELLLPAYVPLLKQLSTIEVHGYASPEGPAGREVVYNQNLSCMRANRAADLLAALGVDRSRIQIFKHGGTLAYGSAAVNRAVVIPIPHVHRVRASAVSMLACAPCNPFTDDGLAAVNPPAAESAIATLRQRHSIEATVFSLDGKHLDPSSPGLTAATSELGKTGYCGVESPAAQAFRTAPGAARMVVSPVHGEGLEWDSKLGSRLGANVPCTLLDPLGRKAGAPCGDLGPNPQIPVNWSKFFLRLYADGTSQTGYLSASTFPFHYLYKDGQLEMSGGAPVQPLMDFDAWATSTGASKSEALAGFKALRKACCQGFVGCPCDCKDGETVLRAEAMYEDPSANLLACAGAGLAFLTMGCPSPCGKAGTDCDVLSRPANPSQPGKTEPGKTEPEK